MYLQTTRARQQAQRCTTRLPISARRRARTSLREIHVLLYSRWRASKALHEESGSIIRTSSQYQPLENPLPSSPLPFFFFFVLRVSYLGSPCMIVALSSTFHVPEGTIAQGRGQGGRGQGQQLIHAVDRLNRSRSVSLCRGAMRWEEHAILFLLSGPEPKAAITKCRGRDYTLSRPKRCNRCV